MSSTNWIIVGALVVLLAIGAWYYAGGSSDTAMEDAAATEPAADVAAPEEPAADAVDGTAEPAN